MSAKEKSTGIPRFVAHQIEAHGLIIGKYLKKGSPWATIIVYLQMIISSNEMHKRIHVKDVRGPVNHINHVSFYQWCNSFGNK